MGFAPYSVVIPMAIPRRASSAARSSTDAGASSGPPAARRPIKAALPSGDAGDAFFRHIVSGMRNGVLAITLDGRLALINDEACRVFDIPARASDLGKPVKTVLADHPDVVRVLTGVFDLHHIPSRAELRLKPSIKVIGYTLALVRDDDGEVVGAAMFFKDLTRVEQLEERERLRDRLAAVGELAAAIAHEVKNPLAAIEINAGRLRRRAGAVPDAEQVLNDIIADAKMANAIVQEVLDFVRPFRLQVERTSIGAAIQDAITLAGTEATRGEITVDVTLAEALPQIQADAHQLTQLFTNLLANAYEALSVRGPEAPSGRGRIAISARRIRLEDGRDGRDAVLVECADDGPGMAEDVAEKVFDPFFTTKAKGSGLGLAIVRKIVDAHDGRLDLETHPGRGTTIRVALPVSAGTDED
jgi:signal transduction histidine kinase